MSCKYKHCITVSGTTNEEIWREIRSVLGGKNIGPDSVPLMESEIADYGDWQIETGNSIVTFDKWLLWRIEIGTTSYGNLPRDKKHDGKKGHCWAPCPYSTQSSDLRTRHMLGLSSTDPLPVKVDHESMGITYYMTTASKVSKWGFECPYNGCTYFIATLGNKYFYT